MTQHKLLDPVYRERFLRSIGIMTERDLARIRAMKIAIGGLGLGGSVFINLVRMGFERFHVADPDTYERTNINRQRMAKETTVGKRKDESLIAEARAINPSVEIQAFAEGVNPGNAARFLEGCDWAVDAVDVFAIADKLAFNDEAQRRGIPLVSCVSVGFGAAAAVFTRETPGFSELSGLSAHAPYEESIAKFIRFIIPEIPAYMAAQVKAAMDRSSHIPFVVPGVEISAAMVTTEIAKHILAIGERVVAPEGIYLDPVNWRVERFILAHPSARMRKTA